MISYWALLWFECRVWALVTPRAALCCVKVIPSRSLPAQCPGLVLLDGTFVTIILSIHPSPPGNEGFEDGWTEMPG